MEGRDEPEHTAPGESQSLIVGDTATLSLQGDVVTLDQFAEAIGHFAGLLAALSREADAPNLRWEVEGLEVGSATTTARALTNGSRADQVQQVTHAFLEVGTSLRDGTLERFSPEVREETAALLDVLRSGVDAVRFETAEADVLIVEPAAEPVRPPRVITPRPAFGSVRGRVQTLSSRVSLRFTLYDLVTDRAVSCYVRAADEELLRDIWGKVVEVEGLVSRDPLTGRPLTVRQIKAIRPLREGEAQGYRRARALLPRRHGEPRAEERIRRLRDGG